MAEAQITNVQEIDVDASFVEVATGETVGAETIEWESSDESVVTVEVDPDNPLRAVVRSTGVVGEAQVFVTGDVDLTAGELMVMGMLDVVVTDAGEFLVEFILGEPRRRA